MNKYFLTGTLFLFLLSAVFFSCKNQSSKSISTFEISDFNPLSNYANGTIGNDSLKNLYLDYTNAIDSGFAIPSVRQTENGFFISRFKLKNNSGKAQRFCYKLYYQNESYKFPESDSISGKYNSLASENFYGSYENNSIGFKTSVLVNDGEKKEIADSIRIIGNPREEKIFFSGNRNDRWKRNPRVGNYSFMLVVIPETEFLKASIPSYVAHINEQKENEFLNPFYYFASGGGAALKEIYVTEANTKLKVIAKPDLGTGIYIDPNRFNKEEEKYFCANCGTNENLYHTATIQQFIPKLDGLAKFENIPVIADVVEDNYSKMDYNWNKAFYKRDELITASPVPAKHPCQTVFSDSVNKKVVIKNPKSEFGNWRKEKVGVITRSGFTYGKWRVKVKMPQLLNKSNVWNGITNAIWLIYQPDMGVWNKRRICPGDGYMANYGSGKGDPRAPQISYSEIDFEILKTIPYCPDIIYPPVYKNPHGDLKNINSWNLDLPFDMKEHDGDITVACTNWDLACPQPKNFNAGCNSVYYNDREFLAHRWDHWYNALTEKSWANDDELFAGKYFYFEIDWQPEKIIWRIGPEPDKMRIVGYMDGTVTNIPNNQMLLVIDQEWHISDWWPISPYGQENIPFPKNDITGEIYEIEIE